MSEAVSEGSGVYPSSVAGKPRFAADELTLPSAPLGLALVLEAAEDEETSLARLGWLVNREPGLATHILRLSNSAAYGVGRPVASVSQATVYMGARTIRNMTLSHIVRTVSLGLGAHDFDTTAFWEHSLRRASAAHVLASRLGYDDPGEAFTAGLIQDIGLLVMAVQWPHLGKDISAAMRLPVAARRAQEAALTGTTHDALFAPVATTWGVPPEMVRAVAAHHDEHIKLPDRRGQLLAEVLRLGDAIADLTQVGLSAEGLAHARDHLENMKTPRRLSLERLVEETAREMRDTASALEIRIRRQPSWDELAKAAQRAMVKVSARYEDETRRLESMLVQQRELAKELEAKNRELERLATTDSLTGVVNRRELCRRLDVALTRAAEGSEPVTVLMLDLDRFKSVNDQHGHDAGDAVLKEAAARLAKALGPQDCIGRIGGEEFAVVVVGCAPEQARFVAERLRLQLRLRPIALPNGQSLSVTASFGGTSVALGSRRSLEETLRQADVALYKAKHGGRNCVVWFAEGG